MNEHVACTPAGVLEQYALGLVTKEHAVDALGLRDYADLLAALGAAGLALPMASEAELDEQVQVFMKVCKMS